jgi:hypothetical protein
VGKIDSTHSKERKRKNELVQKGREREKSIYNAGKVLKACIRKDLFPE